VVVIMQFSVAFYHFALLTAKYSPQRHVFKHQSLGKRLPLLSLAYFFYPEDGGEMFLLNAVLQDPHGATSQKTECFCLCY
jgi:hypothetical protein